MTFVVPTMSIQNDLMREATLNQPITSFRQLSYGAAQVFITLAVPVLLTLVSVRLVMTPQFLHFEYTRPGFPEDIYGFTLEDRLDLAPYAVNYLINNEDLSYLGDLTFPGGERPLFQQDELRHMHDVQVVTRIAFLVLLFGGAAFVLTVIALWRDGLRGRSTLRRGLLAGAMLTLSTIAFIVVFALTAWDFFFTAFHQVFFEEGTWRFAYSDTLIRLFPEQFWFDAALVIGGLTVNGALLILIGLWGTRQQA